MYESGAVLGATTVVGGAVILPNTGGNQALAISAMVSIAVGAAIVISTVARIIAKRAN